MASILKESKQEDSFSISANVVLLRPFKPFNGLYPNVFQIRNYGSTPVYVGLYSNVSASGNYEIKVIGGGGTGIFVSVSNITGLYFFSTGNCNLKVITFSAIEVYPTDLDKTVNISIIESNDANSVVIASELPEGTKKIGLIEIVNSTGDELFTTENPGKVETTVNVGAVTLDLPITPSIVNTTMTLADTEYSAAIPANCKKIVIYVEDGLDSFNYRFAFETLKVATPTRPYKKYNGSIEWDSGLLKMSDTPGSIYFACSVADKIMVIEFWV